MAAVEQIVLKVSTDVGDLEETMRQLQDFKNLTDSIRAGPSSPLSKPLKEIIESALEEYFDGTQPGKASSISIPDSLIEDIKIIKVLSERISVQYGTVVGVIGKGAPAKGLAALKEHTGMTETEIARTWMEKIKGMDEKTLRIMADEFDVWGREAPVEEIRTKMMKGMMTFLLEAIAGVPGSEQSKRISEYYTRNVVKHHPLKLDDDLQVGSGFLRSGISQSEKMMQAEFRGILSEVTGVKVAREAFIRPMSSVAKTEKRAIDWTKIPKDSEIEETLGLIGIKRDGKMPEAVPHPGTALPAGLGQMRGKEGAMFGIGGVDMDIGKYLEKMYDEKGDATPVGKDVLDILNKFYAASTRRFIDILTAYIPMANLEGDTQEEKIRSLLESLKEKGVFLIDPSDKDSKARESKLVEDMMEHLIKVEEDKSETLRLPLIEMAGDAGLAKVKMDWFKTGLVGENFLMAVVGSIASGFVKELYAEYDEKKIPAHVFQMLPKLVGDERVEEMQEGMEKIVESGAFSQLLNESMKGLYKPETGTITEAIKTVLKDININMVDELVEKLKAYLESLKDMGIIENLSE